MHRPTALAHLHEQCLHVGPLRTKQPLELGHLARKVLVPAGGRGRGVPQRVDRHEVHQVGVAAAAALAPLLQRRVQLGGGQVCEVGLEAGQHV